MAIEPPSSAETQPSAAPVYSSPYNVAQQNHALPQSAQILVSTPINRGVLYSTKLNPNKRLFITNTSLLLCWLCFWIFSVVLSVCTGIYSGGIVLGGLVLCCCLAFYFIDLRNHNCKKAEIYSDHLKVCFFCFTEYIGVNFILFQIFSDGCIRCFAWCDIARVNVNGFQGCVGNSEDLVEVILTHGRHRTIPLYIAGDKYAFKRAIDTCMRNHPSSIHHDVHNDCCIIL